MDRVQSARCAHGDGGSRASQQSRNGGVTHPVELAAALAGWERVVGSAFVTTDPAAIGPAQTATYPTEERVLAIVRPANRAEVQACVRVANACSVPLYPVSS